MAGGDGRDKPLARHPPLESGQRGPDPSLPASRMLGDQCSQPAGYSSVENNRRPLVQLVML